LKEHHAVSDEQVDQRVEKKCFLESEYDESDFDDDDDVTSSPQRSHCVSQKARELVCDCCNASFRSCCEGYSREPIDEGATLLSFCSICLVAKGLAQDVVIAQEVEYFSLVKYFEPAAGMGWRWIPGVCKEFSLFSVIWLHLQQLDFLYSPLFCGIGAAFDGVSFQKDPQFLLFVSHCAKEALRFVRANGRWAKVWSAIRSKPECAPEYLHSEPLAYAWYAIGMYLNHDATPSVIRIWQLNKTGRVLEIIASFGSKHEWARKIDVLLRNSSVETSYDLIVPKHELTNSVLF
jgi:hypothetical protein